MVTPAPDDGISNVYGIAPSRLSDKLYLAHFLGLALRAWIASSNSSMAVWNLWFTALAAGSCEAAIVLLWFTAYAGSKAGYCE